MNAGSEDAGTQVHDVASKANDRMRSSHDIKASLAIANGFSQALELALDDLQDSYLSIVNSVDNVPASKLQLLKQHDNDCRFCLGRLSSSLQQLKTRIDQCDALKDSSHAPDEQDDAA